MEGAMLLGAVADDLTGATDLALMLSREGMRTVQVIGVPAIGFDHGDADAVVVALKSRTIPAAEAVSMSLATAKALVAGGARQIVFKYCSTFDSTPAGNIGPVAQALLGHLDEKLTIACPAFPDNRRTVYRGHLFVGDALLSDSPMRDHPLTPMTDANLVRVLQAQTSVKVGLVPFETVELGPDAIRAAFDEAKFRGDRMLVVDALTNAHLRAIGAAAAGMKLVTGGSGIAMGLPQVFEDAGLLKRAAPGAGFEAPPGRSAMLAGSCSVATRRQVEHAIAAGVPALRVDPIEIDAGSVTVDSVMRWVEGAAAAPLVYTSAAPDDMRIAQQRLGRERAGAIVEQFLADVAGALRDQGYRRFVIAGGETSGAVVAALGVSALRIGPEIDPGVPWTVSIGGAADFALALKSGNFGAEDFLLKAWDRLD
jgi:3-dehydrotetronate 4-kinase